MARPRRFASAGCGSTRLPADLLDSALRNDTQGAYVDTGSNAAPAARVATSYRNLFLLACCQALLLTNAAGLISMNGLVGYALTDTKVLAILNGDATSGAHGNRDMPVWGKTFNEMSSNLSVAQGRKYALVAYLESIQAK